MRAPVPVLFIAPFAGAGGSENVLLNVLERLDARFAPRVLVLEQGPLVERVAALGVPVEVEHLPGRWSVPRFPQVAWRVANRLQGRIAAIHANGGKAAVFGLPVARRLRVPLIWMKHDHVLDGTPSRLLAARCDHVVCVSAAMASQFSRIRSRVSVVYPGVELRDVPPPDAAPPRIVSVGRLDPAKGFDELLRAAGLLRDGGLPVQIRIAGPRDRVHPQHEDELKGLAERLGFGAATVGWADDLDEVYGVARVVAMASRRRRNGAPGEGAPLVLMEGMGAGRPAVGPAEPGIAEVIGDAGTLIDAPTAPLLANALRPYLEDPALAARTGARGRERVRAAMTLDRTVAALEALYLRLADADVRKRPTTARSQLP